MPDAQYAPAFWTAVANAFKGNHAVVFDLFNEPFPDRATGTTDHRLDTAGATAAPAPASATRWPASRAWSTPCGPPAPRNIIMIGGLAYSNDLTQWLHVQADRPDGQPAAAFAHIYNFNTCSNTSCWTASWRRSPRRCRWWLSEIGENTARTASSTGVMNWVDAHGVGYLGWTWNTWDCSSGPR